MNTDNPIRLAMAKAGSQIKLAGLLGITPQAVRKYELGWDAGRLTAVPAERAIQIESVTGIPRHALRPDLWPVQQSKSFALRRRATDQPAPEQAA